MTFVAATLAHQGGWDEVLLVGGPIVLIVAALTVAKRRVDRDPAEGDHDARTSTGAAPRDAGTD